MMKKEYKTPNVDFVEFDDVVTTAGSKVHDGSETSCSCTQFGNVDFSNL